MGVMLAAAAAARDAGPSFICGSGDTGAASADESLAVPGDPSVCVPNCALIASCRAISSDCRALTSSVDVPAIHPSLQPTMFLDGVAGRFRSADAA